MKPDNSKVDFRFSRTLFSPSTMSSLQVNIVEIFHRKSLVEHKIYTNFSFLKKTCFFNFVKNVHYTVCGNCRLSCWYSENTHNHKYNWMPTAMRKNTPNQVNDTMDKVTTITIDSIIDIKLVISHGIRSSRLFFRKKIKVSKNL
jgi:hypothetical protein